MINVYVICLPIPPTPSNGLGHRRVIVILGLGEKRRQKNYMVCTLQVSIGRDTISSSSHILAASDWGGVTYKPAAISLPRFKRRTLLFPNPSFWNFSIFWLALRSADEIVVCVILAESRALDAISIRSGN